MSRAATTSLFLLIACSGDDKDGASKDDTGTPVVPDDSADPDDDSGAGDDSGADSADDTGGLDPDLCTSLGLSIQPWQDAEDDDSLGAIAADLTLETSDGAWTLSEAWSGCETYLFIPSQPNQARGWPKELWERDNDTEDLFEDLPRNTVVLFLSSGRSESTREGDFEVLQEGINEALADMDPEDAAWWEPRIHYVVGQDEEQPGWLGRTMADPGWGAAIDRFQRIRYIGSFADPRRYDADYGWFEPNLSMAANEPVYYNFEAERQDTLDADGADVLRLFDGDVCSGSVSGELTLPDAAQMLSYDTMSIDLTMACVGAGEYGNCPAWDYMAYLWACDEPAEDNPNAETPCQPAVAETPGTCSISGLACSSDEDCRSGDTGGEDGGVCEGHVAAIAADTLPGTCLAPTGDAVDSTYTCKADGSGYDDLSCGCSTEVGRWITTYHREGRWVHDVSAYLPLVARGGTQRFVFETSGPYELTLDLRLSNQGKTARPDEITWLFAGGGIYEGSNATYEPVVVTIPADATKVELATVISGHGADGNNCGEFCDMAHWFVVNGDTDSAIVREFPESETTFGCRDQVGVGTVPNQYGTWWYGRAGWCPGLEVPTVMSDITDQVVLGAENTFQYYALFDGAEYTGYSTNRMSSWLVVSR